MQTNITGARLRGALGAAGARLRREPLQRAAGRAGPRPVPRERRRPGPAAQPARDTHARCSQPGRAAAPTCREGSAGRAVCRRRSPPRRRPPLVRVWGLSAADLSPLPPACRFLYHPTTFLPTIPRAGRARAALEPPATAPLLPPPPFPPALRQPRKSRERRRLGECPAPGRGVGFGVSL